jgi:hypothetical protein
MSCHILIYWYIRILVRSFEIALAGTEERTDVFNFIRSESLERVEVLYIGRECLDKYVNPRTVALSIAA